MKDILVKITIFICLLIATYSLGFADTIYLKSGQSVEGKITEETDEYVKIDFYDIGLTYRRDEIESISKDSVGSSLEFSDTSKALPKKGISQQKTESVDSVSKMVSRLRKLSFKNPINYSTTTKAAIKKLIVNAIDKEKKRLQGEEKMLKKLGLLPSYVDYYGLIVNMIPQEIGGYYDPDEKKLFVVDEMPKEIWDSIISHELCHALQDQYFDLNLFLEKGKEKDINSDKQLARQSLVEGEAFAIMLNYQLENQNMEFTALPNLAASMDMFRQSLKSSFMTLRSAPGFLEEAMLFPYLSGLNFLREVRLRHPWEWIENLYKDPPDSSEQIIHPDKYLDKRDEPVDVTLPDLLEVLETSWEKVFEDTLGEFVNHVFLKQFSDSATAYLASEGWGGDKVILFENKENNKTILVYLSVWDSRQDAEEFFWAYQEAVKNKYLEEKSLDLPQANARLWDTEEGEVLLEIMGKDVLIVDGITAELKEKIRNGIWAYVKTERPFVEKETFLKPTGLKAEDFYQKGKAIYDNYRGNTLLLFEALNYFQKATELDKNFIQAYLEISQIKLDLSYLKGYEYDTEEAKRAIPYIEKAKEINPNFPYLYRVIARLYFALKQYDTAEKEIKKAIELDAENMEYYFPLGDIYTLKKEYPKAIEAFNKAILLDPNHRRGYGSLANVYYELKDYINSLQMYKKVLELDPNDAWTLNNYSRPLIELGRYDEAIEALKKALKIMNFGMAHHNLGRAYMGKGMLREAEEEFRMINDEEGLSWLYQKTGQPEKQMQMLEKTLQWDTQNAWAYVEKARLLGKQGNLDGALSYYQEALKIKPDYALVYHDMGQIYETKGDTNKAIEFYNKAIESNPMMSVAYYDLGRVYNVKKQDYYGAIPYLKKSLELNPNYADTYYQLAKSYDSIGNRKDTILNLEKYLELAPNGNEADSVRGYLRKIKNR